jgi:mRNA interferase MazF
VLTRQTAIPILHSLLAVPATGTIRGIPTQVTLSRDEGMPDECALSLDNLTVIPKAYFLERICRLSAERMHEVCGALALATGCA